MHLSRAARLEMYVTIHILTLIAALLLLLMLMWHLSAAHLLEDYGMPKSWTEPFLEKHFGGGQGALWSLALIIVSLDFVHALLSLDYYHGCLHRPRGESDTSTELSAEEKTPDRGGMADSAPSPSAGFLSNRRSSVSDHLPPSPVYPLATYPPSTHQPFLSPLLSPMERLYIQSAYDVLLVFMLGLHVAMCLASLRHDMDTCEDQHQTFRTRCMRINIDIRVACGFDVSLCVVLLGLHAWHAGFRTYEHERYGVEGFPVGGDGMEYYQCV